MHETNAENSTGTGSQPARRKVLGWVVAVINAGVFAAVAAPVVGFITGPLRAKRHPGQWVPVMDDTELGDGETKAVRATVSITDAYMETERNFSAYVSRKGQQVTAYDPSCPHLGCRVEFKERRKRFICPCHGGVFDEEGNVVSGPPPKGLTKLKTKVEAGKIWIYRV